MKSPYIVTLESHSIDLSRLKRPLQVLDVGCRHFDFAAGIRYMNYGAHIVGMEPDREVEPDRLAVDSFYRAALVGDDRTSERYCSFSTGEGNYLCPGAHHEEKAFLYTVPCMRITEIERPHEYKPWDIVKLDCEGSEFEILESWPGPIADQISVEFHDYKDQVTWNDAYFEKLFAKLAGFGYEVLQHPYTKVGAGVWGHWDTLLALRQ